MSGYSTFTLLGMKDSRENINENCLEIFAIKFLIFLFFHNMFASFWLLIVI